MLRRTMLLCLLLLATLTASAQAPTPPNSAPSPLPSDRSNPDAFMRQAADAMSLTAPGMKPFHLHASYSLFSETKSRQSTGTVELWWRDADHYKATYSTYIETKITRTEYRSGTESYYTGSEFRLGLASTLLVHPLPGPDRLDAVNFSSKDLSVGQNKLECFTEVPKEKGAGSSFFSTFCFDTTLPLLRMSVDSFGQRTLFNGIVKVNGHYLAKKIKVSTQKLDPKWSVDIDQIDPQLEIADQELTPPADATKIKDSLTPEPDVLVGALISGEDIVYSATAQSVRAAGIVVLNVTITKDGSVGAIEVISGPRVLVPAVVNAVKSFQFHPYTRAGVPIEFQRKMSYAFNP